MVRKYWTLSLKDKSLFFNTTKEIGITDAYADILYNININIDDGDYVFVGYDSYEAIRFINDPDDIMKGFGFMPIDDRIEGTYKSRYYEQEFYEFMGLYPKYSNDVHKYNL